MTDLEDLLNRATDRLESPGLGAEALTVAHRRRRRRRVGGIASGAVAVVVTGVVLAGWAGRATDEPQPAPPAETADPSPWGLRKVADLPPADPSVAPLLPEQVDVPDLATHVEDAPIDAAVLSVDDGADVLLLSTDGEWRCVVVSGKTQPAPVLSPGGTRLFVAATDGIVTVDLSTGVQSRRPLPAGYVPPGSGGLKVSWLDEQRLVLVDADGKGWVVDVVRDTETRVESPPSPEDVWVLGLPRFRGPAGWTVRPVAQLDDSTGLLEVARGPRGPGGWWVVRWDPDTDDLQLVSTVRADAWKATSYASELLAR